MHHLRLYLAACVLILGASVHAGELRLSIIPKPVAVEPLEGHFVIGADSVIRFDARVRAEAELFADDLGKRLDREVQLVDQRLRIATPRAIYLELADEPWAAEAYIMEVRNDAVSLFYGTRSFLQIIPLTSEAVVPACRIEDAPRFQWRGMMLDVGRHFW